MWRLLRDISRLMRAGVSCGRLSCQARVRVRHSRNCSAGQPWLWCAAVGRQEWRPLLERPWNRCWNPLLRSKTSPSSSIAEGQQEKQLPQQYLQSTPNPPPFLGGPPVIGFERSHATLLRTVLVGIQFRVIIVVCNAGKKCGPTGLLCVPPALH